MLATPRSELLDGTSAMIMLQVFGRIVFDTYSTGNDFERGSSFLSTLLFPTTPQLHMI